MRPTFAVEGRVYKVVEWMDVDGVSHSELLDVYEVTTPEPIRAIQISKKVTKSLLIGIVRWYFCSLFNTMITFLIKFKRFWRSRDRMASKLELYLRFFTTSNEYLNLTAQVLVCFVWHAGAPSGSLHVQREIWQLPPLLPWPILRMG